MIPWRIQTCKEVMYSSTVDLVSMSRSGLVASVEADLVPMLDFAPIYVFCPNLGGRTPQITVKWTIKDDDGCKTWLAVVVVEPRVDNKDVHIHIS